MATLPLPRVEILDLRHLRSRQLAALFEEEQKCWLEELRWDYRPSVNLIRRHIDAHSLAGYVALLDGQVAGYCFFVYEDIAPELGAGGRGPRGVQKGLLGDLFVRPAYRDAEIATALLLHALETLEATPGLVRIEAQLMPFGLEPLAPIFHARNFRRFPRLFMYKPLQKTSGASREERAGSSVGFASLRKAQEKGWLGTGTTDPSASLRASAVPCQDAVPAGEARLPMPDDRSPKPEWVIQRWDDRYFEPLAELILSAYAGHMDSNINDQYATREGALKFLKNIVVFPGCGVFQPDASFVAFEGHSGGSRWVEQQAGGAQLAGALLVSQVAPRVAHVTQVCVRRELQGQGLGRALMSRALDYLGYKGFEGVSLSVTAENLAAVELYRRLGFEVLKEFAAYVWEKPPR